MISKIAAGEGRLGAIFNMLENSACLVDVGTDHGYLVAAAVKSDWAASGIAADINPKPLQKAQRLVESEQLQQRIKCVLTDGLAGISGVDAVVIAGMGGELIWRIIDSWEHKQLVNITYYLQPMSKAEVLREKLADNYQILEEHCSDDSGKVYTVMKVRFTGESTAVSARYKYLGAVQCVTEAERAYCKQVVAKLQRKVDGNAQARSEELPYWQSVLEQVKAALN